MRSPLPQAEAFPFSRPRVHRLCSLHSLMQQHERVCHLCQLILHIHRLHNKSNPAPGCQCDVGRVYLCQYDVALRQGVTVTWGSRVCVYDYDHACSCKVSDNEATIQPSTSNGSCKRSSPCWWHGEPLLSGCSCCQTRHLDHYREGRIESALQSAPCQFNSTHARNLMNMCLQLYEYVFARAIVPMSGWICVGKKVEPAPVFREMHVYGEMHFLMHVLMHVLMHALMHV